MGPRLAFAELVDQLQATVAIGGIEGSNTVVTVVTEESTERRVEEPSGNDVRPGLAPVLY
jgi:hypothetical protein